MERILSLLNKSNYEQALIETQKYLKLNSKKNFLKNMKRFAIESKNAIGTPTPHLRKFSKVIVKFGKDSPDEAFKFCKILWDTKVYENKKIVAFSLGSLARNKSKQIISSLRKMLSESDDWSVCDSLSSDVIRPLMESYLSEILSEFIKWITDKNLWVRRAVPASIAYYSIKHKNGLRKEFNDLLGKMKEDEEYYVKKAVEWAYREMGK